MKLRTFSLLVAVLSTGASAQTATPTPSPALIALTDGYALLARAAMDNDLVDFPSARVKNVRAGYYEPRNGRKILPLFCGEINTKNEMGGYGGWTRFVLSTENPETATMDGVKVFVEGSDGIMGNLVHEFCDDAALVWLPQDYTPFFSPEPH